MIDASSNGFIVTYEPGLIPQWNAGNTGIPQTVDLLQNSSISFPVSVLANTANGGAVGTVTFSASGLAPGMTATFSPASITGAGTTTCTLTANNTAGTSPPLGIYTVDITGTGSGTSLGVVEGQDVHVNVFGASVTNGTYSPISVGQMHWPAQDGPDYWQYTTIDDYGGSGPIIEQWMAYGNVNQQWTITQVGSYYKLIDGAGLALTAPSSSSLSQTAYTGATNQLWSLVPTGVGFVIKNESYGTVLDANNTTWTNSLALDASSGAATQQWVLASNTSD